MPAATRPRRSRPAPQPPHLAPIAGRIRPGRTLIHDLAGILAPLSELPGVVWYVGIEATGIRCNGGALYLVEPHDEGRRGVLLSGHAIDMYAIAHNMTRYGERWSEPVVIIRSMPGAREDDMVVAVEESERRITVNITPTTTQEAS